MAFPTSPSNDDLHTEFGRTFKYSSASNSWSVATPDAPEDNALTTQGYVDTQSLPLTGVAAGSKAFVQDGNKLFIFTGSGWFEIATINTAPTITAGADATYALNSDGTPTVITLQATDPEGTPIIWGYQVTSGSLEDTTITNEGGVFTITPGTVDATFDLAFTASDGVNIDTSASSFELAFAPSGNLLYTVVNPNLGTYNSSHFNDRFGAAVAIGETYFAGFALGENKAGGGETLALYVFNISDGSLYWGRVSNENLTSIELMRMTSTGIYYKPRGYEIYYVKFSSMPTMSSSSIHTNSTSIPSNAGIRNLQADDNYVVYTTSLGTNNYGELRVCSPENMSPMRYINNPAGYSNEFGYALALYGTNAYVGADSNRGTNNSTTSVGVVYVFDITNGSLIHTIPCPDQNADQRFGKNVQVSQDYIAVYASGPRTLYIYNRSDYTLLHTKQVTADLGIRYVSEEGWSVDGKYLSIGYATSTIIGQAYEQKVVIVDMSSGNVVVTLNNPNIYTSPATSDYYGYSVSMFNKKTIVGAQGETGPDGQASGGYAYVYGD